jgi:hypothetical protein
MLLGTFTSQADGWTLSVRRGNDQTQEEYTAKVKNEHIDNL